MNKLRKIYLIIISGVLGATYWLLESLAHAFLFKINEFPKTFINPQPEEFWMRITIITLLLIFGFYAQWTQNERFRTEQEIRTNQVELRDLTYHLQDAREEERQYMAREIHDELGQSLTALLLDVSWLQRRIGTDEAHLHTKLASVRSLVDEVSRSVERISATLRPVLLDDLGLAAAIEWQVSSFRDSTGLPCHLQMSLDSKNLDRHVATATFRILQESLTNIARHAKANQVRISVKRENAQIALVIEDDGVGISTVQREDSTAFGLIGMRERAVQLGGEFFVEGQSGIGTMVKVILPEVGPA